VASIEELNELTESLRGWLEKLGFYYCNRTDWRATFRREVRMPKNALLVYDYLWVYRHMISINIDGYRTTIRYNDPLMVQKAESFINSNGLVVIHE